jgi:hypothetical protein
MTRQLLRLADGKVAIILEGGYNLDSISQSALACVKQLLTHHGISIDSNDDDEDFDAFLQDFTGYLDAPLRSAYTREVADLGREKNWRGRCWFDQRFTDRM